MKKFGYVEGNPRKKWKRVYPSRPPVRLIPDVKAPPRATDIICQSICTDWFFYCLRPSKRPPRPDTLRNANSHRSNTFSTWLKFFEWENHYPDALSVPAQRLDWFLFPAYTFRPFLRFLFTFRDSYNLLSPSVCIIE